MCIRDRLQVGPNLDLSYRSTTNLSEGTNLYYTDARVDTHLNQSNPTSGYVLSWNGADYAWVSNAGYTNADVDTHLNQSNPTSGYVLSWNGSDYAWVAQSTGGSTGDISFSASDISTDADTMNFKVEANNDDTGYEGYYFYGGPTSQGYVRLWTNDAQNETAIKFHVDGTSYYSAMLQRDDQFKMLLNEHGGNIPARIYNMANGTSGHLDLGTRHADGKVRVVDLSLIHI